MEGAIIIKTVAKFCLGVLSVTKFQGAEGSNQSCKKKLTRLLRDNSHRSGQPLDVMGTCIFGPWLFISTGDDKGYERQDSSNNVCGTRGNKGHRWENSLSFVYCISVCVCECINIYIYIYIYIYTHTYSHKLTHTHTRIYIYIYIYTVYSIHVYM